MVAHKQLEPQLAARAMMKMATGRPEISLNGTTWCCPFKSSKPGHCFRHASQAASQVCTPSHGPTARLLRTATPAAFISLE